MAPFGWMVGMKPSRADIEVFLTDPNLLVPRTVPFSVARLSPMTDQFEFEQLFPAADPDDVFWSMSKQVSSNISLVIELRNRKIGVKWSPGDITLEEEDTEHSGRIVIRFQTPWDQMSDIAGLLGPTCEAHGARFLLTWVEEQGLCGYTYFDPQTEDHRVEEWGIENHTWYYKPDPEDDFDSFDEEAFIEDVCEMTGDAEL